MHLTTNVLGSFVIKNGKIIMQRLFPADPAGIADSLRKTENSYCPEEGDLIQELIKTGNKSVQVTNPSRFRGSKLNITFLEEKERVSAYWVATDLSLNRREVDSLIRKVNRILSRQRLKEVDRDQLLIQASDSLIDLDEAINRLIERLREWYSLHYPELDNFVAAHETYARLVLEVGERDGFATAKMNFDPNLNDKIIKSTVDSLGVDFTSTDLEAVKTLAKPIVGLYATKVDIEAYIGELMEEVAPNVNALAGATLGARLISLAHGLNRLATLPAGTIQLLGAEDAFFRFLKTGKKPPKHGAIFQLPAIRNAGRDKRGKIARTFAAKVALASRADAYHGEFAGDRLKAEFEKRVKALQ
jgi:nucleolar protein 56